MNHPTNRIFEEFADMKESIKNRTSEHGGAGVKFLLVFLVIVILANAGYNYVPVAYQGASFRQEMDTAVVKGLAASGRIQPLEAVTAHIRKASTDYNVPNDALIDIKVLDGVIQAHVSYQRQVNLLPFGMYKYDYKFDYVAKPQGYLLKQ